MPRRNNKSIDVYLVIAKNIKKHRRKSKMTQRELAQKSGYSYSFIRRIEGPTCVKNFSIQAVYNLSKILNIDIKELFDERDI